MKYSVIIPVYRNEATIPRLLDALGAIDRDLGGGMEAVFVVDGSPDGCFEKLRDALAGLPYPAQLLAHSRNFGSYPAIRSGLAAGRGEYFGVMAADLQEPPELIAAFFRDLSGGEFDIVIGARTGRDDPIFSRMTSNLFWGLYRRLVEPAMPEGGVDVFGCNRAFRDELLKLEESRSSLIALVFWLGFRRKLVTYRRLPRREGKSAWSFSRKIDYMFDSVFAFTDYPIRLLTNIGAIGSVFSIALGAVVFFARLTGSITVPGYAATMLVVLVFGALNLFGLGLVGTYAWRSYENSKRRPLAIVAMRLTNTKLQ